LGLISRTFVYKEKEVIVALFKSLVRPHLDYCIQAWRPYLSKDIALLEKVQRRATKVIKGFRSLEYEERLKKCGLTTLETRRMRADMIEVFKIIKGMEGLRVSDFFDMDTLGITRGHKYKLHKRRFRSNVGKYSFGNRVVDEWNSLPEKVVMAESINMFKRHLDHYLGHIRGFK